MVVSEGSCRRSCESTVRPPTPESNTPIGRALRSATRELLALLRDEAEREGVDRLAYRGVRVRDDERVLLVERVAHRLPVGRDLGDDRQIERVLDAALRHSTDGV